jgi:hypothetical protein
MSIYRQIEDSDKVFGRVRKVSSGMFSTGFELNNFNLDKTEVSSKISGWMPASSAELITDPCDPSIQVTSPDIGPTGKITNFPKNESGNLNIDLVDEETTLLVNKCVWSDTIFGDYYMNVYNEDTYVDGIPNDAAESQFTLSYGNSKGYGSMNGAKSTSATRAIYNQYKNILLGPGDSAWTFTLDSAVSGFKDRDSIYVINFSSSNLKEKFDPGNLEFRLSVRHGDTLVTETFKDDSRVVTTNSVSNTSTGKVYQIVRGSIIDETTDTDKYATGPGEGSGEGFGFAYPDLGILILNPFALSCHFGNKIEEALVELGNTSAAERRDNEGRQLSWYGDVDPTNTEYSDVLRYGTERNHQNFLKLFGAIKLGSSFKARSTEFVPSKHYFIRVKNTDFNYSNNPSFVFSGKQATDLHEAGLGPNREYWVGRMKHEDFVDDPQAYITTVGLYNDDNELVAVAKLSVPILKSFDTETLIKVKLDF